MLPIRCFMKNAASSTERLAIVILSIDDDLTYVYAVDNRVLLPGGVFSSSLYVFLFPSPSSMSGADSPFPLRISQS